MRVASLLALFIFVALASSSTCEAQRRSPAPFGARAAEAPLPDYYRPPSVRTPSWKQHVVFGMVVGGAAGLAWGIVEASDGENVFGLSPVIETVIGIGAGGYAGTAVYLARSLRR